MSTAEQNPSPSRLDWPHRGAAGFRTVLVLYADGKVMVPFSSYGGQNTGPEIPALATDEFRAAADTLFGFTPGQKHARADPGWLRPSRVDSVPRSADRVAQEYDEAVRLDADGVEREGRRRRVCGSMAWRGRNLPRVPSERVLVGDDEPSQRDR